MTKKSHKKLTLGLFLVVILLPVAFAWMMAKKSERQNFKMTHHGDLISPAITLPASTFHEPQTSNTVTAEQLKEKWWVILVAPVQCSAAQEQLFYNLQQMHTALGKSASRVERMLLTLEQNATNHCQQYITDKPVKQFSMHLIDFERRLGNVSHNQKMLAMGEIFLMDPQGNVMMHYDADTPTQDILKDLKRLLRISKIG